MFMGKMNFLLNSVTTVKGVHGRKHPVGFNDGKKLGGLFEKK